MDRHCIPPPFWTESELDSGYEEGACIQCEHKKEERWYCLPIKNLYILVNRDSEKMEITTTKDKYHFKVELW